MKKKLDLASTRKERYNHLVQLEFAGLENTFPGSDTLFLETLDGIIDWAVDGGRGIEGLVDHSISSRSITFKRPAGVERVTVRLGVCCGEWWGISG